MELVGFPRGIIRRPQRKMGVTYQNGAVWLFLILTIRIFGNNKLLVPILVLQLLSVEQTHHMVLAHWVSTGLQHSQSQDAAANLLQ